MKDKSLMLILAGVLLAMLLAGCGNDVGTLAPEKLQLDKTPGPDWTQTAPPSETFTPGPEGSGAGDSGQGSSEPGDSGQVRLLYFGGELTEAEESAVLEALTNLYRNMEVPDYLGEAIHMVATEEWFKVMAPGTYEGGRSYTLQQGALTLLTVQIGVDSAGVLYADIRFQDTDGKLLLLKQFGTVTRLLEAAMKDNELDGAFTNWTIDSANGGIIREQGTYSDGLTVGEYTRAERVGTAGDAFDLWTHREDFKYTVTTSYFDEQGNPVSAPTAAPKPTATPKPATQATPKPTATPKPATQATPKPTATPKPATQATPKPTVTPKPVTQATPQPTPPPTIAPAATPVPTAIPTSEPVPEPDPDEDEDDYYEPEPTPEPEPEPEPEPTPEPEPEPTPKPDPEQGNEVDQEWSVDILG